MTVKFATFLLMVLLAMFAVLGNARAAEVKVASLAAVGVTRQVPAECNADACRRKREAREAAESREYARRAEQAAASRGGWGANLGLGY